MNLVKLITSIALAGLLGGGLSACNKSSSGAAPPVTATGTEFSGVAEAPGGAVAMFERRGALYALGNFLLPTAGAAITGLQPVTGALVELIYVDDNGNQVGDVLASTTTSITGDYRLTLPAGVDFAANLVVRISNGATTLDAQVVSTTVNINPYSDFLLDKLIANGTSLAALPVNEVVTLRGRLEEFDLTAGADMAEMFAALEAAAGQYVDDRIATINNGTGSSEQVAQAAGEYHVGEFGLGLSDSDGAATVNQFSSLVARGSVAVAAAGGAQVSLAGTWTELLDSHFNVSFPSHGLYHELRLDTEEDSVTGTVDGSGAITASWDFEEEIVSEWGYGFRWPAGALRMVPVANTGIYFTRISEAGVRYTLTEGGAVDPQSKHGDDIKYSLMMFARKSTGLDESALDGNYGMVWSAARSFHTSGVTEAVAAHSVATFDGSGSSTEQSMNAVALERAPNSAPVWSVDTATSVRSYTVAADGVFALTTGDRVESGFVGNDGNVLALFFNNNETSGDVVTSAEHGMAVGVKLPSSQPAMSGRTYHLQNLMLAYGPTSTSITHLTGAVLTFNNDGTVNFSASLRRGVRRTNDTADLTPLNDTMGVIAENHSVTVGANGSIDIASIATSLGNLKLIGYVSADGNMLVLRATSLLGTEESVTAAAVGLYVGSLQP